MSRSYGYQEFYDSIAAAFQTMMRHSPSETRPRKLSAVIEPLNRSSTTIRARLHMKQL